MREYWQYDPTGDYLKPVLQGLHLVERNYWPLPARREPNGDLFMHSAVLGLDVQIVNNQFRFADPVSGRTLYSHAEAEQAWRQAEQAQRPAGSPRRT